LATASTSAQRKRCILCAEAIRTNFEKLGIKYKKNLHNLEIIYYPNLLSLKKKDSSSETIKSNFESNLPVSLFRHSVAVEPVFENSLSAGTKK